MHEAKGFCDPSIVGRSDWRPSYPRHLHPCRRAVKLNGQESVQDFFADAINDKLEVCGLSLRINEGQEWGADSIKRATRPGKHKSSLGSQLKDAENLAVQIQSIAALRRVSPTAANAHVSVGLKGA